MVSEASEASEPKVPELEVSEALEVYQGEMFLSCYGELGEDWF